MRPEERWFIFRAWLGAPCVRASLALGGLRRTLRWVDAIRPLPSRGARRVVGVGQAEALVGAVFRRQISEDGTCLPCAVLQYSIHRRDGLAARLVVGVRRHAGERGPLTAHAWVEDLQPRHRSDFDPVFVVSSP
jgi:hypothetical protein